MYTSTGTSIASFKGLIKTHKGVADLVVRPVVNCIGSPTYKLSWLMQRVLQHAIPKSDFSKHSSSDITDHLKQHRGGQHMNYNYPFSLAVANMYTSIPTGDATDLLCQKLASINFNYNGIQATEIRALLRIILDSSFFQFEGSFYKQTHGLPMGSKISGLLADVFMSSIEQQLVQQLSLLFYYRYVDDCLIVTTSKEEAETIFIAFNSANQHIKYEIEHPKEDGELSLLDFSVSLNGDFPRFRPYTKAIKSDLFLSGQSAIPTHLKQNVIINEWRRIKSMCSGIEDKRIQRKAFIEKLRINGHQRIPHLSISDRLSSSQRTNDTDIFYLSIPFVDDMTDHLVRKAVSKLGHNVRISHNSTTLGQMLQPKKSFSTAPTRDGKCNLPRCKVNSEVCYKSMVVYQAKCAKCLSTYIGSTKKFLHLRIKEHFSQRESSIFQHNASCQGQWSFNIRHSCRSLQSLRWAEAIIICQEKPRLNRKEEGGLSSLLS
jgi:hypothetical protein